MPKRKLETPTTGGNQAKRSKREEVGSGYSNNLITPWTIGRIPVIGGMYPPWYYRWRNSGDYSPNDPRAFDSDLSDLDSESDDEKQEPKNDGDNDNGGDDDDIGSVCECESNASRCACPSPPSDDDCESNYDPTNFEPSDDEFQFEKATKLRNARKRELRDRPRIAEAEAKARAEEKAKKDAEAARKAAIVKDLTYDEIRRDLLLEAEEAIRKINDSATSDDRYISNKTLWHSKYLLVPTTRLKDEHLAKTLFQSELEIYSHGFSERLKPTGNRILKLMGFVVINDMLGFYNNENPFFGPDRTGNTSFLSMDNDYVAEIKFHDRHYIEIRAHADVVNRSFHQLPEAEGGPPLNEDGSRPELKKIHDPNAIVTFYGIRCSKARNKAMKALEERMRVLKPRAPASPRETWLEQNHSVGEDYDTRDSEYF